jgi:hypothetical protein
MLLARRLILLGCALVALASQAAAQPNAVRAYRIAHEADMLREFLAFLACEA